MTTTPRIDTELISIRIALTAAPSAPFLSPRPTHRAAAIAAASVTRVSSRARLRSGAWVAGAWACCSAVMGGVLPMVCCDPMQLPRALLVHPADRANLSCAEPGAVLNKVLGGG